MGYTVKDFRKSCDKKLKPLSEYEPGFYYGTVHYCDSGESIGAKGLWLVVSVDIKPSVSCDHTEEKYAYRIDASNHNNVFSWEFAQRQGKLASLTPVHITFNMFDLDIHDNSCSD